MKDKLKSYPIGASQVYKDNFSFDLDFGGTLVKKEVMEY